MGLWKNLGVSYLCVLMHFIDQVFVMSIVGAHEVTPTSPPPSQPLFQGTQVFCKPVQSVHRCTRVENPGGGEYLKFLPKSLGGIKGFRKIARGGSTYFGFYCIFINKFFENLPGVGVLFHTPLTPLTLSGSNCISKYSGSHLMWSLWDRKELITFTRW